MRQNEAFAIGVNSRIYLDLMYQLRKHGDMRAPEDIVVIALKEWQERHLGHRAERGYQWKELLLPNGTKLRLRHHGIMHYADVEHDEIIYQGKGVTPRSWALLVTGSVRNPWRDIWIKRDYTEAWTQASAWRAQEAEYPKRPGLDRRLRARRACD
jgi:hypothetical protein